MGRHKMLIAVLWATAVWAGGAALAGASEDQFANRQFLIETGELARILPSFEGAILDLRALEDYRRGHLPKAVHLSLGDLTVTVDGVGGMMAPRSQLEATLGKRGIGHQTPLVLYGDADGLLAARLFWLVDFLGHEQVRLLNGGWRKWSGEGRSTTNLVPDVAPTRYVGKPVPSKVATADWVLARIGSRGVAVVDARSPPEFRGEVAGRAVQRAGRIPGAVNVDWRANLSGSPKVLKSSAELRRLYENAEVTVDQEVVVYCRTGVRAAFDYFVLRLLGYSRVRIYDGSWLEWGNRSDLPLERG